MFDFLTYSSATRLYRGRVPRLMSDNSTRQSGETMTSISAGHIILTPTQPVGSGRPQRKSNPRPGVYRLSYRAPFLTWQTKECLISEHHDNTFKETNSTTSDLSMSYRINLKNTILLTCSGRYSFRSEDQSISMN